MRLSEAHICMIRHCVDELSGKGAQVRVFGSRLDDEARGGDVDLLIEFNHPIEKPALLAAQVSARVSRSMQGRKVDVLLMAPNLRRLPIHDIAMQQGELL